MNINNRRYADDTALVDESGTDLQELINALDEKGKPYGMEMNVEETNPMVVSKMSPVPRACIALERSEIKQKASMVNFGHKMTGDGKNETKI